MRKLILKLTHRVWNREISRILCREYSLGLINSRQLHVLASRFDPTQRTHCKVGKDYGLAAAPSPQNGGANE